MKRLSDVHPKTRRTGARGATSTGPTAYAAQGSDESLRS